MSSAHRRSEDEQKQRVAPFVPFRRTAPRPAVLDPLRSARTASQDRRADSTDIPAQIPAEAAPTRESRDPRAISRPPAARGATHGSEIRATHAGFAAPPSKVVIPRIRKGDWRPRCVALDTPVRAAERFRQLAVRAFHALEERGENTLLVTSPGVGEGKTTTSFNLALAMASLSAGKRIALVDLNLRRPAISRLLGVDVRAGVEAVIQGYATTESRCARSDFAGLDIFPIGTAPQTPHELFSSRGFVHLIEDLRSHYRTVVFDAPPVLSFPDVELALAQIRSCLLVARSRKTRLANLEGAAKQIRASQLLGVFLNNDPWALDSTYGKGR